MRRRVWWIVGGIAALLLAGGTIGIAWVNPQLTRYLESYAFRKELEKETAKGLHFPSGHYEPIKRTGTWTAESAGFQADNGCARDHGQVQSLGRVSPALATG